MRVMRLAAGVGLFGCWIAAALAQQQSTAANLAEIRKQIAGHEEEMAEKVFKNIELLKGRPASRLPGMMEA
jgi:hypothetical protein